MKNARTFYYFAFTYRFFYGKSGQAKTGREVLET
jgi:hypothetical protein